ncbi:PilZ domain-containing protein [Desulfocastanea catecholica]
MSNEISLLKSFVKADDEAMIVCPACDTAKKISAAQFRHRQHLVKVKCKCGHLFKVHLEFRRHFRKTTELEGTYDVHPPAIGGGRMKVVNLSLSGACVEVWGVHDLKIGQKGSLVFTLDNRKKTVLFKKAIIRSINGNRIGCEFVQDQAYDKDLGFYLLP